MPQLGSVRSCEAGLGWAVEVPEVESRGPDPLSMPFPRFMELDTCYWGHTRILPLGSDMGRPSDPRGQDRKPAAALGLL